MRQLAEFVFAVDTIPTRGAVRRMSEKVPGSFWLGEYYYIHQKNNRECLVYLSEEHVDNILRGREIAQTLTGRENVGWTYSRMARECTEWLNAPRAHSTIPAGFLPNWHYQKCVPCTPSYPKMFDLRGAYWQFLCMLPSPVVTIDNGVFHPCWISPKLADRWYKLRTALAKHKEIRLAFVGVNASGWDGKVQQKVNRFSKGNSISGGRLQSDIQTACIVAVRSTYEVTAEQSDRVRSVYSNADCVVTENGKTPELWAELGLRFRIKAEHVDGETDDIHNITAYKIGSVETLCYREMLELSPTPIQSPPIVGEVVYPRLLRFRG